MVTGRTANQPVTLMERGELVLNDLASQSVEIARGMAVLDGAKRVVGNVAAVVTGNGVHQVSHILLVTGTDHLHYRLVPTGLITTVADNAVQLKVSRQTAESLPLWHGT